MIETVKLRFLYSSITIKIDQGDLEKSGLIELSRDLEYLERYYRMTRQGNPLLYYLGSTCSVVFLSLFGKAYELVTIDENSRFISLGNDMIPGKTIKEAILESIREDSNKVTEEVFPYLSKDINVYQIPGTNKGVYLTISDPRLGNYVVGKDHFSGSYYLWKSLDDFVNRKPEIVNEDSLYLAFLNLSSGPIVNIKKIKEEKVSSLLSSLGIERIMAKSGDSGIDLIDTESEGIIGTVSGISIIDEISSILRDTSFPPKDNVYSGLLDISCEFPPEHSSFLGPKSLFIHGYLLRIINKTRAITRKTSVIVNDIKYCLTDLGDPEVSTVVNDSESEKKFLVDMIRQGSERRRLTLGILSKLEEPSARMEIKGNSLILISHLQLEKPVTIKAVSNFQVFYDGFSEFPEILEVPGRLKKELETVKASIPEHNIKVISTNAFLIFDRLAIKTEETDDLSMFLDVYDSSLQCRRVFLLDFVEGLSIKSLI